MLGLLGGYAARVPVDPSQEIHALRTLRSMLHGFATLETDGGFRFDTDIDDSFTWMVTLIDHGLQATTATAGLRDTP